MIPTVAPYILPGGLLPELREKLPSLAPQIVEDQTARLLDALRSGALDVAVLALPAGTPGLVEVPVYEEDFVMVVPNDHSLAGRVDLTADVLDALPLLLLDDGHCLRDQTLDLCRSVDAHPLAGDTRATSLATVVQCVAGGGLGGVTLVPESAVAVEVRRGDLSTARFASPAPGRTIGVVFRSSSGRAEGFRQLAELVRSVSPTVPR